MCPGISNEVGYDFGPFMVFIYLTGEEIKVASCLEASPHFIKIRIIVQ